MKAPDTSGLFETTRQVPTELSKAAVLDFIKVIPTLPPPSNNWFQNFNLNSIIMTTTAITLVTSALIYFSIQTDKQETVLPSETELSTPIPIDVIDEIEETDQTKLLIITVDTVSEKVIPKPKAQSIKQVVEEVHNEISNQTDLIKDSIKRPNHPNGFNLDFGNVMNAGSTTKFNIEKVSLSGTELLEIKNQLIKYVEEDQFYFGSGKAIIFEYLTDSLQINFVTIRGSKRSKYLNVFSQHNISPGLNRKIIIDKKYIMVGDFTSEGFEGSALGDAMQVEFKKIKKPVSYVKDGIFKVQKGPVDQIEFFKLNEPKRVGGFIVQKLYSPKNYKMKFSERINLLRTSGESLNHQPYAFREYLKTSQNSATLFDEKHRDNHVIVSTRKLKVLSKELYKKLLVDKLIERKGSHVRISLEPNDFSINNQKLSTLLEKKYLRLLSKFKIKPAQFHKLLMSADFIVVGAFENNDFHGSVMGNIETDKVRGSLLEQDFKGISIFGF